MEWISQVLPHTCCTPHTHTQLPHEPNALVCHTVETLLCSCRGGRPPPWRPPGIASPPKSRSPSPERATPPRRTSFSLGYYGPDHDDDARLFLEPASASAGKKRRVAASGTLHYL
eukprot:1157216-Pelagomonas_calceolata.AAC.9